MEKELDMARCGTCYCFYNRAKYAQCPICSGELPRPEPFIDVYPPILRDITRSQDRTTAKKSLP